MNFVNVKVCGTNELGVFFIAPLAVRIEKSQKVSFLGCTVFSERRQCDKLIK